MQFPKAKLIQEVEEQDCKGYNEKMHTRNQQSLCASRLFEAVTYLFLCQVQHRDFRIAAGMNHADNRLRVFEYFVEFHKGVLSVFELYGRSIGFDQPDTELQVH